MAIGAICFVFYSMYRQIEVFVKGINFEFQRKTFCSCFLKSTKLILNKHVKS